jgi:hypothetical protein
VNQRKYFSNSISIEYLQQTTWGEIKMDLQTIRDRWVNYNLSLLDKFTASNEVSQQNLDRMRFLQQPT